MRLRDCHCIDVKKYTVTLKFFMKGIKLSGDLTLCQLNSFGIMIFRFVDSLTSGLFHKHGVVLYGDIAGSQLGRSSGS